MYLGIEIGGTKLQLGLGPGDGTLAGLWRGTVAPAEGAEGIRRQIESALAELLASAGVTLDQVRSAGVGFGGPVDDVRRRVIKSHQIAGWDDFPLADWMMQVAGLPTALGNDADVAGLGEALYGAGARHSPLFYVTIGSGIGGGLIVNREIYRAVGKGAAEIGHLRFPLSGKSEWGPLEEIASGWSIQRHAREVLGDPHVTTADLARRAAAGDRVADELFEPARVALAEALCHVIALLCPARIVLGGGVSLADESVWLKPVRAHVERRVFAPFANCTTIVTAALGEAAVVHGAIGLAIRAGQGSTDGEWSI